MVHLVGKPCRVLLFFAGRQSFIYLPDHIHMRMYLVDAIEVEDLSESDEVGRIGLETFQGTAAQHLSRVVFEKIGAAVHRMHRLSLDTITGIDLLESTVGLTQF